MSDCFNVNRKSGLCFERVPEQYCKDASCESFGIIRDENLSLSREEEGPRYTILEGENLLGLDLLIKSGLKSTIDLIFVDPPYNTGNPLRFHDNFGEGLAGHVEWLSQIERRIRLGYELLSSTGVMVVCIDDIELAYLRLLLDDVFGEENFIATVVVDGAVKNNARLVSTGHDYMLFYSKNLRLAHKQGMRWREPKQGVTELLTYRDKLLSQDLTHTQRRTLIEKWLKANKHNIAPGLLNYRYLDTEGNLYRKGDLSIRNGRHFYNIPHPVTKKPVKIPLRGWAWKESTMLAKIAAGEVLFGKDETTIPVLKRVLKQDNLTQVPRSYMRVDKSRAYRELSQIIGRGKFDYPKDLSVVTHWLGMITTPNSIVLDFYAGSGTTGHAVALLNGFDGGNRRAILITNNEEADGSANGIAREVTAPRMKAALTGEWVVGKREGLPGSLEYYRLVCSCSIDKENGVEQGAKMLLAD